MFGILLNDFLLNDILFFAIPAILIVLFGVSLYRYLSAKKQNKATPGTYSLEEMTKRKLMLIISSVVAGILAVVVLGFVSLMFMAVAFM